MAARYESPASTRMPQPPCCPGDSTSAVKFVMSVKKALRSHDVPAKIDGISIAGKPLSQIWASC
jgi:hypothetical protein